MTDITSNDRTTASAGMSRRVFVKVAGAAIAGGILLASGGRALHMLWEHEIEPGDLTRSLLAQHVGDTFDILAATSNGVAVRLSAVRSLGATTSEGGAASEYSFSVLFRGPTDRPLAQNTYQFNHPRIGRFPLFIVPMAPTADARYYEAIFNNTL